ncbi:MAG: hypothetical protein F4X17_23065 [Gemmatimonadetes bacterium]|nr:hypothetical protein [Gemmatimonadota bacterium]
MRLLLPLVCVALAAMAVSSETLTFQGRDAWATWRVPLGLTEVGENGQLQLVKFRKDINAVADAHRFSYESKSRGKTTGGIWEAVSNPADADYIIDGDPQTFWRPDPVDAVEDWAIEIDLGRAVLAREIRLVFPDEEGARPFRQFTVYGSTGTRISVQDDMVLLEPLFRTTRPNAASEIVIPLGFTARDSVFQLDEGLGIDPMAKNNYRVIQRIRIEAEEKTPDAALAEIEVRGIGDNISIGTMQRGRFVNGVNSVDPQNLFDADMNTNNLIGSSYGSLGWKEGGVWFGVDLGAVFFVDEFFLYSFRPDEGLVGFSINGTGPGHTVLYSDGTRSLSSNLPVPDAFDYTELLTHINPNADRLLYIRYMFKPRKMRYFFWHGIRDTGWGIVKWAEFMLFSPGYPAEVVLHSDFIDLGQTSGDGRPKVIKNLSWDAELAAGTRLQLRSRSGNSLEPVYTFYNKIGEQVTEEKWNSSPKVLRGPVDTTLVVGEDWGEWSNVYQFSGETFQSESPRRFILLEMILSTDDPSVAPVVHSLSVEFEDALLQGAVGRIEPRQAIPNEDTRFTYTLWPQMEAEDSGFDLLRFTVPGRIDAEDLELHIGSAPVAPARVEQQGDSLLVALPRIVTEDSIRVGFTTRVLHNATVFPLDLGLSERPGLWQSVEPAERRSQVVMLPELAEHGQLIDALELASPVITPNGDGINDALDMRFVVFKLDAAVPTLALYDLAGRQVAEVEARPTAMGHRFTWTARDASGTLVAPGIYLYRLDLGAESGPGTHAGSISVVY